MSTRLSQLEDWEGHMLNHGLSLEELEMAMQFECPHCNVTLLKIGVCPSCRADFSDFVGG